MPTDCVSFAKQIWNNIGCSSRNQPSIQRSRLAGKLSRLEGELVSHHLNGAFCWAVLMLLFRGSSKTFIFTAGENYEGAKSTFPSHKSRKTLTYRANIRFSHSNIALLNAWSFFFIELLKILLLSKCRRIKWEFRVEFPYRMFIAGSVEANTITNHVVIHFVTLSNIRNSSTLQSFMVNIRLSSVFSVRMILRMAQMLWKTDDWQFFSCGHENARKKWKHNEEKWKIKHKSDSNLCGAEHKANTSESKIKHFYFTICGWHCKNPMKHDIPKNKYTLTHSLSDTATHTKRDTFTFAGCTALVCHDALHWSKVHNSYQFFSFHRALMFHVSVFCCVVSSVREKNTNTQLQSVHRNRICVSVKRMYED